MILSAEDLSYSYGDRLLFENITFNVEEGDKYGIIGVNGTGKSTLLRMIANHEAGDGKLTIPGSVVMEYLPQDPPFEADATVLEQVFKGDSPLMVLLRDYETAVEQAAAEPDNKKLQKHLLDLQQQMDDKYAWQLESEAKAVLTQLGITNLQQQMGELSGGQRKRVALAGVLVRRSDLLILDEPTNHLDLETMEWLENYLKAYRGAVLVVSHDRYFLDAVCTRIWELRGKSIKTYRGNYSAYLPQREAADERQQKLHDAAVEKAAKLQDYVDRNLVRASTTKMAQSRRRQLEKLEIVEAPTAEAWELNFRFEYDIEPYDELVIMKNLSVHIGERTLIDALDYVVHRGDKLVIAGPNGAGKSTLLQVLDGKRRPSGGMVRLGSGAKPGIFTQQQARRAGRVMDAIWNQYPRFTELEVRSHLARFGYRGEEVFKDCASLSGGELARLRFAELALERPNLMFLDEPTNHLDIYMRESLTQALAAYTGTLLLVTHDRYLMQTLDCPIMYLENGSATFYQNFAALQNREAGRGAKVQETQQKAEDSAKKQGYGKEQRKRRAEVRARLKKVETEIEELGAHIVELENEINDPEVLRDHLLLRDKCDELDDTRVHQQELYEEWEKLAEEQERFENEGE